MRQLLDIYVCHGCPLKQRKESGVLPFLRDWLNESCVLCVRGGKTERTSIHKAPPSFCPNRFKHGISVGVFIKNPLRRMAQWIVSTMASERAHAFRRGVKASKNLLDK